MKKETILKVMLILLPVLALGLATTQDSVSVFDTRLGTTVYGSYFTLLPVGAMQMCAPVAGLLCAVTLIFSILFVIRKKPGLVSSVKWLAFAAALAAVIPVILRGDVLVVPHVGVPIFMCLEWAAAYMLAPKNSKEPAKLK